MTKPNCVLSAVLSVGALAVTASSALAHITLAQGETHAGSSYKAVLQVPHGCAGSPTQGIRVSIPAGVIGAKPMPKAGWTLEIKKGAYAKAYQSHGRAVTDGTLEIAWLGGTLSDDNYDEFVFTSFITSDFAAGQRISFPTVQTCAEGESRWTGIPAPGQNPYDLKSPAPSVMVVVDQSPAGPAMAQMKPANSSTDSTMDHSTMDHGKSDRDAAVAPNVPTFKAGNMVVTAPWTRATPGGAKIASGYFTLANQGTTPDRLTGVTTAAAGRVEVHEMSMDGGVMKMRELSDGLTIKPGETVALSPGGFHMMLMDLKQPLKQGDTVPLTLTFEKAGKLDVVLDVGGLGATEARRH